MKLITVLMVLMSLSGCVGGYIITTESTEQRFVHLQGKNKWVVEDKESAIAYLGMPDSTRTTKGGGEVWTYRESLAWRGAALVMIVPIPLLIPFGFNRLELRFSESGKLIEGKLEGAKETGCAIFFPIPECMPDNYV
ncbi:hypothetical protein [Alcanivorax sp.]|jgi:uncharacterized protein YceK|nr:hypothetical protein [Alcanivorax sp.]